MALPDIHRIDRLLARLSAKGGMSPAGASEASQAATAPHPTDPLSVAFDLIDRPRRAVAQVGEALVQGGIDAAHGHLDIGKTFGDLISAPERGLFSQNKSDQETTDQEIENLTDYAGKYDPHYKDVADNVNPWVKGIGGFLGDVATDPLTYVPIPVGLLARGAKLGGTAIKAATDAVRAAPGAAKAAEKTAAEAVVAADAAKAAAKVPENADVAATVAHDEAAAAPAPIPVPETPAEAAAVSAAPNPDDVAAALLTVPKVDPRIPALEGAGVDGLAPHVAEQVLPAVEEAAKVAPPADLAKMIAEHPDIENKQSLIRHLLVGSSAAEADTVKAAALKEVAKGQEDIDKYTARLAEAQAKVAEIQALPVKKGIKAARQKVEHVQSALDMIKEGHLKASSHISLVPEETLNDAIAKANAEIEVRLEKPLTDSNNNALDRAYSRIDQAQAELARRAEVTAKAAVHETPMQRFAKMKSTTEGEAALEQHLGTSMVKTFSLIQRPEKFQTALKDVSDILHGDIDVNALTSPGKINTPQYAVWDALGIPAREVQDITTRGRELAAQASPPMTPEELVGTMSSPSRLAEEKAATRNSNRKPELRLTIAEKALHEALPKYLTEDHHIDPEVFVHKSGTGVARTEQEMGKGLGRREAIESFKNYSLVRKVRAEVDKLIDAEEKVKRFRGVRVRNADLREANMAALKDAYQLLDNAGAPVNLTWSEGGKGAELYRASLTPPEVYEVLSDALKQATGDDRLGNALLFGRGTRIADTNLYEAVTRLVNGHDTDSVMATLLNEAKKNGKDGKVPEFLTKGRDYAIDHLGWAGMRNRDVSHVPVPIWGRVDPTPKGGAAFILEPAKAQGIMRVALEQSRDALTELSRANAARYAAKGVEDTMQLSTSALAGLAPLMDSAGLADQMKALHDLPETLAVKASAEGRVPSSVPAAEAVVHAAMPDGAAASMEAAAKQGELLTKPAATEEEILAARAAHQKQLVEEGYLTDEDLASQVPEEAYNTGDVPKEEARLVAAMSRGQLGLVDTARKLFDDTAGIRGQVDGWSMLHESGQLHRTLDQHAIAQANELMGPRGLGSQLVNGEPRALHAWRDMQAGTPTLDPQTAQVRTAVEKILDNVLDLKPNKSIIGSTLLRSTNDLDALNRLFDKYSSLRGVKFEVEDAVRAAQKNGTTPVREASKQWVTWDVEDMASFLVDLPRVAHEAATHASVADSFMRELPSELWSKGRAPGMVPLTTSAPKTALLPFLPKGLYVHPEIAHQLLRMDEILNESRTLSGAFGKFMQETIDPLQQAWKRGITVLRPGHHIRNAIGDWSSTVLADGLAFARRTSVDALKVMQQKKSYQDVDLIAALEHLGQTTLSTSGDVLSRGKYGELNAETFWKAFYERGLAPDTSVVEDLALEGRQGADQTFYKKALKTVSLQGDDALGRAVSGAVGTVTEARDHYQRLQHFMQIIYKAQKTGKVDMGFKGMVQPKDLNHLFELAAEKVVRAHPDASLLTNFEYKYLRRVIPFYSWTRGAVPFLLGSAMRHPGRVTAFNKASYSLAVSMGVHPDSLSDPFPTDQMFPSFLTDKVQGPQFKVDGQYFSFSPGFTSWDVPNTFSEGPVQGIASMINPGIRVPGELMSGALWGTQSKIKDTSDYLDQQIPGGAYFDQLTGISPTGSIVSLLRNEGLDATYNAAKGRSNGALAQALGATNPNVASPAFADKPGATAMSALNYLLGPQAQNYSRDDFTNYAEIEKRNAAKAATTRQGF